jgi:hypothetical protein
MINRIRLILTLSLLIILTLTGCKSDEGLHPVSASPVIKNNQTEKPQGQMIITSKEQLITQSSPPRNSQIPSQSPITNPPPQLNISIVNLDQEHRMAELLQDKKCQPPCYLGITPGKTTWEEAQKILGSVGASSSGEWREGNLPVYEYNLWIGDSALTNVTPNSGTTVGDLGIAQKIKFTVENDLVQRIGVWIQTRRFTEKYREYWSRFSLEAVLRQIGQPGKIYMWIPKWGTGYGMLIIYEDLGIFLDYSGIQSGNSICPLLSEKQQSVLEMTLTNTSALPDIYPPGKVPPTDREVYLPIKDALGIDEKEFYNRLLLDPSTCFEIKETN